MEKALERVHLFDGIFWFNINWLPEGMIGWAVTGSGYIEWDSTYVYLHTGMTAESIASVLKGVSGRVAPTWEKKRRWMVRMRLTFNSSQYIHIVTGTVFSLSEAINPWEHAGYKIIDDTLYGTVADHTAESTLEIETLPIGVYRTLDAIFTPGVEARFIVDGVDKGAITTNLPSGTAYASNLLRASVFNTIAAGRAFHILEVRALQEE